MKRFYVEDRVEVEGQEGEGVVLLASDATHVVVGWLHEGGTRIERSDRFPVESVTMVTPNPNYPVETRLDYGVAEPLPSNDAEIDALLQKQPPGD